MGLIIGEIRAALGAIGALFGIRRRRLLLLEGRQQLDKVFREAVANLAGIRQSWSAEHDRMNWLARLHGDLLHTGAWRGHRAALTTRLDGGPVIEAELAGDLDQLYDELDESAGGFRFDWEPRLVDVALRLRDVLEGYPPRWWNQLATARAPAICIPAIDTVIVTPPTPEEVQRRVLAKLPRSNVRRR